MFAKDVLTQDIESVSSDSAIPEAADKMKIFDVGVLPVCEAKKLEGIITDRDIVLRAVAEGKDLDLFPVSEIMSRSVQYCFLDDRVKDVALEMEEKKIRSLPVVNSLGEIQGIISLGDLATRGEKKAASEILEFVSRHPV